MDGRPPVPVGGTFESVAWRVDPKQRRYAGGDLAVVVPIYNNAATLAALCDQLKAALGGAGISFELLFVNDGTRDAPRRNLPR